MTSISEEDSRLLLLLDELKERFSKSFVKMSSRSMLQRLLQYFVEHEDNSTKLYITDDVKETSRVLLVELESFFMSSRVGILMEPRERAQELLRTVESAVSGISAADRLPKNRFKAVGVAAQRVLPADMKYTIAALGRRPITVYVDPLHENYSSTSEIADSINRYLHTHGQINVIVRVEMAENGTILR
jgi:hypothetical protein